MFFDGDSGAIRKGWGDQLSPLWGNSGLVLSFEDSFSAMYGRTGGQAPFGCLKKQWNVISPYKTYCQKPSLNTFKSTVM